MPGSLLYENSTSLCVAFDLFESVLHVSSMDYRFNIISLLEILKKHSFTLILFSKLTLQQTKELLKEKEHLFEYIICEYSNLELDALGKSEDELIFFSEVCIPGSEQWHLPFDFLLHKSILDSIVNFCNEWTVSPLLGEGFIKDDIEIKDTIRHFRELWNSWRQIIRIKGTTTTQLESNNFSFVPHVHDFVEQQTISRKSNGEPSTECIISRSEVEPLSVSHGKFPTFPPSKGCNYKPPLTLPTLRESSKDITIALDLDGTLIHSKKAKGGLQIHVRPYTRTLLRKLCEMKDRFDVVLFTAATKEYAESIIRNIDLEGAIDEIFHRAHCSLINSHHVKELRLIGRKTCITIDDNEHAYMLNKEDTIPVSCWKHYHVHDDQLLHVCEVLNKIYLDKNVNNYRRHISNYVTGKCHNTI